MVDPRETGARPAVSAEPPNPGGNLGRAIIGLNAHLVAARQSLGQVRGVSDVQAAIDQLLELKSELEQAESDQLAHLGETRSAQGSITPLNINLDCYVSKSPVMLDCLRAAHAAVESILPTVITGASGCGKKWLARAIHNQKVAPKERPFVYLNLENESADSLRTQLFGSEVTSGHDETRRIPGAVELANGGTLFLDQIANLGLVAQQQLLELMEIGQLRPFISRESINSSFKLIVSTTVALKELVDAGKLSLDLYYGLSGIEVNVPKLADRVPDLDELVQHISQSVAAALGRNTPCFSKEASAKLLSHTWPGNLRELRSVLTFALEADSTQPITADLIRFAGERGQYPIKATEGSSGEPVVHEGAVQEPTPPEGQRTQALVTLVRADIEAHKKNRVPLRDIATYASMCGLAEVSILTTLYNRLGVHDRNYFNKHRPKRNRHGSAGPAVETLDSDQKPRRVLMTIGVGGTAEFVKAVTRAIAAHKAERTPIPALTESCAKAGIKPSTGTTATYTHMTREDRAYYLKYQGRS